MSEPASLCPTSRIARIENALREALPVVTLQVIDDSHLHAGHAGARDGRGHYRVCIVSEEFAGLKPLARHQRVYNALGKLMQTDIHALGIEALTPREASALSSSSNSETR
jgi:BolA family transcriptional regulator, general stress-responsive regulator